uniref:Thioredoxin domain-containing protein n=1 Tax=viral metagenome TaxID=1070528 RepID=A0A6C0JA96_9ZZZZ
MNKLQKDIVFYSNYCLHCNNLLNKLSKTILQNKIFYVCIDDKKIKIPKIVNRVPSLYLVNEKKVLIENDIDIWVDNQLESIKYKNKQMELQKPISAQIPNMSPHPSQDNIPIDNVNNNANNNVNNNVNNVNNNVNNKDNSISDEIIAYHGNEMGSNLSTNYSFLDDTNNSSLNNNFTFVDETTAQAINTPKDFNDNNQVKSELDQQYEKMMDSRQNDPISKGIQRI